MIVQRQNLSPYPRHKTLLCTPIQHHTNKTNINGLFLTNTYFILILPGQTGYGDKWLS